MTREEIIAAVRAILEEEIMASVPCSCCGSAEIHGIEDASVRIAALTAAD